MSEGIHLQQAAHQAKPLRDEGDGATRNGFQLVRGNAVEEKLEKMVAMSRILREFDRQVHPTFQPGR